MTSVFTAVLDRFGFRGVILFYIFRKAFTSAPFQDVTALAFTASVHSAWVLWALTISDVLPGSGWSPRSSQR